MSEYNQSSLLNNEQTLNEIRVTNTQGLSEHEITADAILSVVTVQMEEINKLCHCNLGGI